MAYRSLRDFIARLENAGELVRVNEPVSTVLEMTEIQTRLIAEGGPAVIFEKPIKADGTPSDMPVLVNLFGTVKRVAMGVTMGGKERTSAMDLREVGELLAQLRQPEPPRSLGEAASLLPLVKTVLAMKPKTVSQTGLPGDRLARRRHRSGQAAGPDLLAGRARAADHLAAGGDQGARRRARGQLQSRHLSHAGPEQDPDHHALAEASRRGAASPALGEGEDRAPARRHRAGRRSRHHPGGGDAGARDACRNISSRACCAASAMVLADCVSQPLKVPAEAEIVIEGEVSLSDYRDEGPYGDHTGYYNSVEQFPVFTVTAITMRKDPIYLSTYTARPPDEPSILGEALNEVFVPLIRQQFPEIVDFWLPPEGCSYRIAVVSMKKAFPGHAKRVMMAVWSYLRQFMYTKWVIVVDDDIDARDWKDVMWAVSTRMDPARDITVIENTPIDYLDFASPESGLGSKIGLDATNKLPPETHREWGRKIAMDRGRDPHRDREMAAAWACPAAANRSGVEANQPKLCIQRLRSRKI